MTHDWKRISDPIKTLFGMTGVIYSVLISIEQSCEPSIGLNIFWVCPSFIYSINMNKPVYVVEIKHLMAI